MNSPESLIARILKWAFALFIAAIVLRWTVSSAIRGDVGTN